MQELIWRYPDRLLNESLKQIAWEASSSVGRADLVFEDRYGRLLVIEVKRGKLPRGAIDQLLDYFGMIKERFPDKPVEMMVVANVIPSERRLACESRDIECREISDRTFREVAIEGGYRFASEETKDEPMAPPVAVSTKQPQPMLAQDKVGKAERGKGSDALYVLARHPKATVGEGKRNWLNKWHVDGHCLESITTTLDVARRCEAERDKGNAVYIYRPRYSKDASAIVCSAFVGKVDYSGSEPIVHFTDAKALGDAGQGILATDTQRQKAKQKKTFYDTAP